ncbi:MAG TPA: hypothetical protein VFM82_07635 [Flavobacteriaceae bacterium]|nr:hypothetical protein [Flavobacteriaceae bacterium]
MERSFQPFTAFTTAKVFKDGRANVLCNQFVDQLSAFPGIKIEDVLLTGDAAKIMQGSIAKKEVKNIQFITSNVEVFRFYQKNLNNIFPDGKAVFYAKQMQIVSPIAHFELWLSDVALDFTTIDGVHCQDFQVEEQH